MKYRLVYLIISLGIIGYGIYGFLNWGFNVSIDFSGGTVAEYKLKNGEVKTYRHEPSQKEEAKRQREEMKTQEATELRFENVEPVIGSDLIKKTIYALILSAILILFWIAYQFKSIKFGVSATIATLHDTLILLGSFAILGHFFNAEVDFLFVTAMLTTLSFSVHDTIVVYDRIRETQKRTGGDIIDVANTAITETMVRSLNNSFTIVFMLLSLILLGGETTRWFAVALLVGTISGTYSSPFVAVPLLVTWDKLEEKRKK